MFHWGPMKQCCNLWRELMVFIAPSNCFHRSLDNSRVLPAFDVFGSLKTESDHSNVSFGIEADIKKPLWFIDIRHNAILVILLNKYPNFFSIDIIFFCSNEFLRWHMGHFCCITEETRAEAVFVVLEFQVQKLIGL